MTLVPEWCAALPGVTGAVALDASSLESWPDRALDDRLQHLQFCPVTLQELYQIVRFLPLVVLDGPDGPMVMADLRSRTLRRPAFDRDGQLQLGYRPAATRLLPFLSQPDGQALRLTLAASAPDQLRPPELRQQILQMLSIQIAGYQRLQAAARLLIARGYLSPGSAVADAEPAADPATDPAMHEGAGLRLSGREWLPATEQPEAAIGDSAGPDGPLALRLLAAIEFSQMHRRQPQRSRMPMDRLRDRLGRDDVLRQALFIDGSDSIDFSSIAD